ncbi:MAG: ABC transporter substrate-binding protein [Desulfobacterales bacterium]
MKSKENKQTTDISRRAFLTTAAATGLLSLTGATKSWSVVNKTNKLDITMAGYDYDRVKALIDGSVEVENCTTSFEVSSVGEMNTHIFTGPQTRAVTEVGLHPFMLAYTNDGFRDYTLIPVFPLRTFRHKSIYIRTDRGIKKPDDLRGKRIATPGYSSSSLVWIRGIVQDEYGLTPKDVHWVIAANDSAGKVSGGPSKQENVVPKGLSTSMGPAGKDESDLLESGEVDALFHAAVPRAYTEGHPKVARLFPDSRRTEQAYYSKTGIFPIMHAVAIKKAVLEKNPWLIEAVFNAYSQAKQSAYDYLTKSAWYKTTLPWVSQELEDTRALMGRNFWSYGLESNRKGLDTFFRYSYEQGLCSRTLSIEELFHPSSLHLTEL